MKAILTILGFITCGVLTASCDGKDTPATLNPCTLLTDAELTLQIGVPIEKTDQGASQTLTYYCNWYGQDPSLHQKGITLLASTTNGKEFYDSLKALTNAPVDVADFGDGAYVDTSIENSGITLYRGNTFLKVSPLYSDSGVTTEMCKALAVNALTRLP